MSLSFGASCTGAFTPSILFSMFLISTIDSAIGELLKGNSNNAYDWMSAFIEGYESGKDITWREEDGTN